MKRSERLGVKLLDIRQAHVGTDKSVPLINSLTDRLRSMGVEIVITSYSIHYTKLYEGARILKLQ